MYIFDEQFGTVWYSQTDQVTLQSTYVEILYTNLIKMIILFSVCTVYILHITHLNLKIAVIKEPPIRSDCHQV